MNEVIEPVIERKPSVVNSKETQTELFHEITAEEFQFEKHFGKALVAALYYVMFYLPFVLPVKVWGNAGARLSTIWENKILNYKEQDVKYSLFTFYFNCSLNLTVDAIIFLAYPIGFIYFTYDFIASLVDKAPVGGAIMGFIGMLFVTFESVLGMKLFKETLIYIINNLVGWMIEVMTNMGKLIKNMWLLNVVIKKKNNARIDIKDIIQ